MDLKEQIDICTSEKGEINTWKFKNIARRTEDDHFEIESLIMKRLLTSDSPIVISKCLDLIRTCAENGNDDFVLLSFTKIDQLKEFQNYESAEKQRYKREILNKKVRESAVFAIETLRKRNEEIVMCQREKEDYSSLLTSSEEKTGKKWIRNPFSKKKGENFKSIDEMTNVQKIGRVEMEKSVYQIGGGNDGDGGRPESKTMSILKKASDGLRTVTYGSYDATKRILKKQPYKKDTTLFEEETSVFNRDSPNGVYIPSERILDGDGIQEESDDSGLAEKQIVDDFSKIGGVKINPTKEELKHFLNRCDHVKGSMIAFYMNKTLQQQQENNKSAANEDHHPSWKVQYRSLLALKTLIQAENDAVIEFFQKHPQNIKALTRAEQVPVSKNAIEVLKLLKKSEKSMFKDMIFTEEQTKEEEEEEKEQKEKVKTTKTLLDFF